MNYNKHITFRMTQNNPTLKRLYALFLLVIVTNFASVFAQNTDSTKISAKWETAIATFEKSDLTNPPPKGGFEFIGSSTIVKWKTLKQDFTGYPVFNRGFGGSRIIDSFNFASRIILPYMPKKIFFHAGDNDLSSGKSPEQVFVDFKALVQIIHANLPKTEIFFISLKPSEKRRRLHFEEQKVNNYIQEFTKNNPFVHYIDTYNMALDAEGKPRPELFAVDQLHFNEAGYKLLADKVRPFLEEKY